MTKASNPRAVIGDNTGAIDAATANRLRGFVERVERLDEEIAGLNTDKRDVYAEAKGTGFDVAILRKVIARRRMAPEDRQEIDALLETYEAALGLEPAPGAEKAKKGGKS